MLENIIFVFIGLLGLFFGGDWLVTGASRLARSFGVSALIVGLTVVAFGTSSPELLVSMSAALRGSSDIAVGNIVGSNISNIGLILGMTALIFPVAVRASLIRREIPLMMGATLLTTILAFIGASIDRLDGVILLIGLIAFNYYMYMLTVRERQTEAFQEEEEEYEESGEKTIVSAYRIREVGRIFIGLIVLVFGAQLTVDGAVNIARSFGISELAIGVTLVAVGTSLPELATSLVASFRKQNDIAIGNIVGSNIFNLLLILGATALIRPIPISARVLDFDIFVMLAFSVALIPITFTARQISRLEAMVMLGGYIAFSVVALLA